MNNNEGDNRKRWVEQEAQRRWGYQNIRDFEKQYGGKVANATKPVRMPKPNINDTPFDKWEWEREDPDFYESFVRMPEAKDP